MSDWISTSERLPPDGASVLCVEFETRNVFVATWAFRWDCWLLLPVKPERMQREKVTHWMPLPESP